MRVHRVPFPPKGGHVGIKDPDIFRIVERLGDHFINNISNRFVRKALMALELPQAEWDRLDNLTAKSDYYKTQGFLFDELYEMILAAAHFIGQARERVLPHLRAMLAQGSESLAAKRSGAPEQEKVLRDMAAQNFPVNLSVFSDLVNELYLKTTNLDRQAHEKKRPVYERIPELKDIGRYLVNP